MILNNELILKQADRQRIAAEVERFLDEGGKIRQADTGHRHAVEAITERARVVRFGNRTP